MKNVTRILITTSLVLMVSLDAYSQDIFNSAKVGIGTVSPQQKLDVAGSIRFSGALMPGGLPGSTGNILLSNGAGSAPTWLSNGTTGTILVANSAGVPTWSSANSALLTTSNVVNAGANSAIVITNGIGQVIGSGNVILDVQGTLNGVLYGQGTGNSAIFTLPGTSGQVLEANSSGIPTWTTPSLTAGWALNGNNIAATNFLGTTDAEPLVFEVNGKQAGRIDLNYNGSSGSNTYFGSWGILGSTTYGSPGGPTGDGATINVGIGISALGAASANGGNVAVGAFAYPAAIGGNYNVAVGTYSQLYAAYTGSGVQGYNVTIGAYSLYSNSLGYGEVAIGHQSMYGSGSPTAYGYYNTALGYYSLYNVGSGGSNVALGSNALISTTAGRNTAAGDSALYSNTTGEYNTGLGYQSNVGAGNLTNATAIGYQAVAPANNSITLGNTAVTSLYLPGYTSAGSLLYTSANTGLVAGVVPGAAGTILESTGSTAPTWVSVAGINSVSGTPPIYITNPSSPTTPNIGIQGLPNNSDAGGVLYSLGSGTSALFTPSPTTSGLTLQSNGTGAPTWAAPGSIANAWALTGNNISATNFLGTTDAEPLVFEVDGKQGGRIDYDYQSYASGNTYLGSWGVLGTTTYGSPGGPTGDAGTVNVGIGVSALGGYDIAGNTGNGSTSCCGAMVAVGAFAYPGATGGEHSVAIGAFSQLDAAFSGTGNIGYTVSLGAYSLYSNSLGNYETAVGYQSMYGNGSATTYGNYNTALGTYSLYNITTGGSNTALGSNALYNTLAGKNTGVGDSSLYSNTTGEYNTGLGYQSNVSSGSLTNATAIGYQAVAGESNSLVLGNGAASVGINTSTPAQLLEIGGTANTIRVDGLAGTGAFYSQINNTGNIVYTNNTNGDLYSLPNGSTGNVLTLNTSGVPTWGTASYSGTTYSITGNAGTSVVVGGGNVNSVVGSANVTLDVQGTQGGVFYGNGSGTAASFTTAGTTGQVLTSNGVGAPSWSSLSSVPNAWYLTGNTISATYGTNYLGTTGQNEPLVFKVNNKYAGMLDAYESNVYLGGGTGGDSVAYIATGSQNVVIGWEADVNANSSTEYVNAIGANALHYNTGTFNNAVGAYALHNNTTGSENDAFGFGASEALTTGTYNVAMGFEANYYNQTGTDNVSVGDSSMWGGFEGTGAIYTGATYNTAVGVSALSAIGTNATSNTALGYEAAIHNTTGNGNVAIGYQTGYNNTTGSDNTLLGYQANVSSGALTNAAAIGYQASAPASNSITLGNSAVAYNSSTLSGLYLPGYNSTGSILYTASGTGQVASLAPGIAGYVLESQGTSSVPTWISIAGVNSVTGTAPIYINSGATTPNVYIQGLPNNSDAGGVLYSLGSATSALFTPTGSAGQVLTSNGAGAPTWSALTATNAWLLNGNTINSYGVDYLGTAVSGEPLMFKTAGVYAGLIDANASDIYLGAGTGGDSTVFNSAVGTDENIAIGYEADATLASTTVSSGITAIGAEALHYNQTSSNTAVGAFAEHNITTGTPDDAFGYGAGANMTIATYNVSIGFESNYNQLTGSYNVAAGDSALYGGGGTGGTPATYNASYNTAVGVSALSGIGSGIANGTGGSYNTAVGYEALIHTSTGTNNVAVGYQAGNANSSGAENTLLGYQSNVSLNNLTNATAIGYQAIAPGSNSVTLGNSSVTSLYLPGYSAVGDLLYTSTGTGLVTGLTPGLAGTVLSSNGTSSAPTWSSVTGVNNVSGIAPIYVTGTATAPVVNIQGLPNNSDMGGVLYSLGSGNSALFTPSGVLGEVLQSNGTAAPTWVTPSAGNVWSLTGNTGTIPGTNYLGTLDDNSLEFEVNGHNAGSLDPLNTGYSAANVYLGSYGVLGSTTYGGAGNNDAGNGNVGIGLSALGSVGGPQYVGGNTGTTTGYNASQVAVGAFALASDIYGESNTALGSYSQFNENWASEGFGFNTSAGAYSLFSNSTGQYNTAIGIYSMYGSGTPTAGGSYNTAEGYNSLYTAGVGASNTALGSNSLYNNTGSRNTAVGDSTLYSNTSGTNNTALGYQANVTGNPTNATVIGYGATQSVSNSITLGNSAVTGLYLPGYTSTGSILYTSAASGLVSALTPGNVGYVLESQGTSSVPTWVSIAGANSLSGTAPVYITGPATSPDVNVQGLPNNSDMGGVLYSTGSGNAAVFTPTPTNAGLVLTSSAAGAAPTWQSAAASANSWNLSGNAGTTASNFLGTTSNEPLIFKVNGGYAGDLDYTDNATILGYGAASAGNTQYANGTASWPGAGCTIIGFEALYNLGGTTGPGATYVGAYALYNLTTAPGTSYDVAVGYATHFYPGPDNVANTSVGSFSLYSDAGSTATGSQEVALGYQSMFGTGTSSGIFGNSNVAIGYNSYFNPTGGQGGGNTAVGSWALYSGAGGGGKNTAVGDSSLYSNSTGEYNTGLGYQANVSAGNLTNATAIGYQAVAGESNSLVLGNGAAFVGINTSIPAQLLEVGGTANTIRVDGLKTGGTYNSTISASPGNIVYSNNANGDLYSLPNGTTGTVLTLNGSGVPTWSTIGSSAFTTYSITGNAGTSVVVAGGNLNSVVGSGNVTLDVQGTAGGVFYGTGASPAAFTSAGTTGQVLSSNGAGAPAWATLSVPNAWSINGNAGTTPGTNFIGTSSGSNEDLMFKVNGVVAGSLDAAGNNNAYYGYGVGVNGSTPGNGGSGDWGNQNVGMGTEAMGNIPANNSSVTGSEAIGAYAMYNSTAAFYNSAIGAYSQFNNAADYNVSVGAYTLYNNSAGLGEVALGHMSMYGSGTPAAMGNYNTAIGYYSLYSITTGGSNTAVGSNALFTSTGGRNSAVGDSALYLNTTGEYNTAVGYQAGYTNTTGAYNTLLGYNAGLSSNNLSNATVIGYNASAIAGNSITLGNTAATALYLPGYSSVGALLYTSAPSGLVSALTPGGAGTILASNGSGSVPTWISIAGINSVSGTSPIYVNSSTPSAPIVSIQGLSNNSDAGGVLYSLGSGTSALFTPTPSASGLVLTSSASGGAPTWQSPAAASSAWLLTGNAGTTPGTDFVGTTNAENLMFKVDGVVAGSLDEGSNSNAYYGYGVGVNGAVAGNGGSGDYGADNVGVGTEAMGNIPQNATSVTQTEAIGAYAMYNATAAYYNIAMGAYSQYNNGADFNASVGAYSLYSNNAGANEVALGYGSMYGTGTKETMGSNNTAIGYYSLYNSSTGGSNTAVGSNSLYNSSGGRNAAVGDSALVANTTGEWNTAIGYQSGITNTTGIENTLIGYQANVSANNLTNATAVGYNASAPSSNSVTLGNTSVTSLYLPGYTSVGDLLYTSTGSGLVSALTPGAAGTVLSSNGTGNIPTWTNVAGVNSVTGTAPIYITNAGPNPIVNIQGLPNNSDMGGVLYSTGSASSAVFTATPAAGGLILTSAAAGGAPTWQSPSSVSGSWTLSGNANATATSILGTTNAEPLVFEANSYPAGRIDFGTNDNAYYGYGAGTSTGDVGVSGGADVGVGLFALGNATTPTSSEAIGAYALYNAANVYDDVAFGAYSQFNNASYANVSVGSYSLYSDGGSGNGMSSTTGLGEVALGHMSMYGTGSKEAMGNYNTAIGYYSLYSGTSTLNGGSNTAVGSNAMFNTTGGKNTAVGDSALASNTSGEYNTAVGYQALTTALASGANYNTALGYLANVSSTTASNATAVGANALASANNTLILGAINGVNSATISAAGNPGITNVGIGTNTPDADAALAIKTGHLETQVSVTGATSGITDPASGNLTPLAIAITGTDVGGNLSWVEGSTTTPTSGAQVQISFINAYATGSTPTVILTPANLATAQIMGTLQPYVSASSNTGFTLSFAAGSPVSGTTYSFNYFVIETQ